MKDKRGFNTEEYEGYSVNELRSMWENRLLDMTLVNNETNKKIYIKYHLDTKIKSSHIYDYIEDLFELENILTNKDELIIIIKDNLNDSIKNLLSQIYLNDKKFINIFNINSYLFNILKHRMVPEHRVLSNEERKDIEKKYYITDKKMFPEISRFDPVAQCIGVRTGELVEITRSSPTAINSIYYRLCI